MKSISRRLASKLALFCAAAIAVSCQKDPLLPDTCLGGDCDARMIFPAQKDANGYYHVALDWSRDYLPYFILDIEASEITPENRYTNNYSYVQAKFDSDTSWIIGDTLVMQVPIFKPFTGVWTSNGPLPTEIKPVYLTQFAGIEVNVVQNTNIQFRNVDGILKSRRVVGPFIPQMIGDTVTIAMKVEWNGTYNSQVKDNYLQKFIVE